MSVIKFIFFIAYFIFSMIATHFSILSIKISYLNIKENCSPKTFGAFIILFGLASILFFLGMNYSMFKIFYSVKIMLSKNYVPEVKFFWEGFKYMINLWLILGAAFISAKKNIKNKKEKK